MEQNHSRMTTSNCRKKKSEIISEIWTIKKTWKSYFERLLNQQPTNEQTEEPRQERYACGNKPIDHPTVEEVRKAIVSQKKYKTPDIDKILSELYKSDGDKVTEHLSKLIASYGDAKLCLQNRIEPLSVPYTRRDILLLCMEYKIFSHILTQRLQPFLRIS